jgi:hypothetical protein
MRTRVRFHVPEGRPAPPGLPDATVLGDGSVEIRTENPTKVVHELTSWALEHDFVFDPLEVTQPSLEDVYLDLTGENHDGEEEAR